MEQNDYINAIIKSKMHAQELTLKELSTKLGIPLTTLHYRISGKYQWHIKELRATAEVLDIPAEQLLSPQLPVFTHSINNRRYNHENALS